MSDFKRYLQQHEIDAVALSIAAKIRYSTAWNAQQGGPIPPEDAQKIKTAVHTLTGVPYLGPLSILQHKQQNLVDRSLCPHVGSKVKKRNIQRWQNY